MSRWAEFQTSVASRLTSLFNHSLMLLQYQSIVLSCQIPVCPPHFIAVTIVWQEVASQHRDLIQPPGYRGPGWTGRKASGRRYTISSLLLQSDTIHGEVDNNKCTAGVETQTGVEDLCHGSVIPARKKECCCFQLFRQSWCFPLNLDPKYNFFAS